MVPLQAWGQNFNFSIWFIALRGCTASAVVLAASRNFRALQEKEAVRLCLKYFRQQQYLDCFQVLQVQTKVQLECPALSELYQLLVTNGNFHACEQFLATLFQTSELLHHFSRTCWVTFFFVSFFCCCSFFLSVSTQTFA